jgi:secreted trypsin-like serine protease
VPISSGQVIARARASRRAVAVAALLMLALSIAQPWADANASPERVASGSYGGLTWQARSLIVGTTSTATLAGGGNPAYFPAMPQFSGTVALLLDYGTALYVCSGALLPDRRSILTAAHCVSDGTATRPRSTTVWFYGGSNPDTVVPGNPMATSRMVSDYFVHEAYTGEVVDQNDIAVLRLNEEAPDFAASYDLYEPVAAGLTGMTVNLAGYGRRSDTGGSVGANLDSGRLRQGDNQYAFRFGDPDFGGFWDGFFGSALVDFSYVVDFDSGLAANDSSCRIAATLGLGGAKYCNTGLGEMESANAGGDSGGPNFVDGRIASVTSYGLSFGAGTGDVDNSLNDTFGEFSGLVPVYLHAGFIRDHMVTQPGILAGLALRTAVVAGCKNVTGTITLFQPAPASGVVVLLSDTLASASPPASVKIAAGATSKSFIVKTQPVLASEAGIVSAAVGGDAVSQPLTVRPMGLHSVSLSPTRVVGSQAATGLAKLECKAGPGPISVDLSSSNPAVAGPVAASMVVPQGVQSASFDVTSSAVQVNSSATIAATANGTTKSRKLTVTVAASVSPKSLRFGEVLVGTTSAELIASLSNLGTVPFAIDGIELTGTNARYYSRTSDCPANLAPGASCSLRVTFSPMVTGSKSAKLSIATSASSTPLSLSLYGAGI